MGAPQLRIGVMVHDGYQELEFWYPVLRFREAGAKVTVFAASGDREYASRLGYPVLPDQGLAEVAPGDLDALLVPGGAGAAIAADPALLRFIAAAAASGAVIGASSEAVAALVAAGLSPPVQEGAVATLGKVITARSVDDLPAYYRALDRALGARG